MILHLRSSSGARSRLSAAPQSHSAGLGASRLRWMSSWPLSCGKQQPERTAILNFLASSLSVADGMHAASRDAADDGVTEVVVAAYQGSPAFQPSRSGSSLLTRKMFSSTPGTSVLGSDKGSIACPGTEFCSIDSGVCDGDSNVWWLKHTRSLVLSHIDPEVRSLPPQGCRLPPPLGPRLVSVASCLHNPTFLATASPSKEAEEGSYVLAC